MSTRWRSTIGLAHAVAAVLVAGSARAAVYIGTSFEIEEGYTIGKLTPSQPNPVGDVGWGADSGITHVEKSFFWNFSNKWLSADGTEFVCIFTGTQDVDSFNAVKGQFLIDEAFRADLNPNARQ